MTAIEIANGVTMRSTQLTQRIATNMALHSGVAIKPAASAASVVQQPASAPAAHPRHPVTVWDGIGIGFMLVWAILIILRCRKATMW